MRVRNRLLADTALIAVRPYADLTIEGEGDEGAGGGTLMDQGAADSGADQGQAADNSEADASQGEGGENAADSQQSDKDDAKLEEKPEGAPEAYADFTAPEGVELDADTLDTFKAAAKELNLPQDKAQSLVDMAAALVQKQADAFTAQMEQTTAEWRQSSMTDSEFGGTKLSETLKVAAQARDKFATPELAKFLSESKLGDHPEMIRLFWKVGQAISEDSTVLPGKPAGRVSFYDHPTSKPKTA